MSAGEIAGARPGWTAARAALLLDHYRAGLSAAQSADLIGAVSKNAVISKRRRLGLVATAAVGRDPAIWNAEEALRRRGVGAGRIRRFRGPPPLPVEPLPEMDHPPPPEADPRRLTERRAGGCAWPLGPAEAPGCHRTLFCGAPAAAGVSYCATHAARAYRPRG